MACCWPVNLSFNVKGNMSLVLASMYTFWSVWRILNCFPSVWRLQRFFLTSTRPRWPLYTPYLLSKRNSIELCEVKKTSLLYERGQIFFCEVWGHQTPPSRASWIHKWTRWYKIETNSNEYDKSHRTNLSKNKVMWLDLSSFVNKLSRLRVLTWVLLLRLA